MTAEASARNDPAHRAGRVPCPVEGCAYTLENVGSIPAHLAMKHPEVPMDRVAPKRGTTSAAAPEPTPDGSAPRALVADERATPGTAPAAGGPVAPAFPMTVASLPIDSIHVAENIRDDVGDVTELTASIKAYGLLQPITVQQVRGRWIVVTGHRRLKACRLAGLHQVAVQFRAADEEGEQTGRRREVQLVENRQRVDLNPLEEARAFRAILDGEPGLTQAKLAERQGIAPSTLANALRLLEAAPEVQAKVAAGSITAAHAKAIIGLDAKDQVRLAEKAEAGASAHSVEQDAAYLRRQEADRKAKTKANAAAIKHAIAALAEAAVPAGTPVRVNVPYDMDGAGIRAAVAEAGWPTTEGWGGDEVDGCGCETRTLAVNGGKDAVLGTICLDTAHRQARQAAKDAKRHEADQARDLEHQLLRGALLAVLPRLGPTLLRVLLRDQENYAGKTWKEYGKLDNAEVVKQLASHLTNGYGAKPIPVAVVVEALRAEAVS